MKRASRETDKSASALISARIAELGDWRGKTLAKMRALIRAADPGVVEEWKWEIPIWSHDGIICTGESYKKVVKLTFAKGASLKDPARLFNSSLEGNVRRAIDIHEGETVNATAFKALIRQAAALNTAAKAKGSASAKGAPRSAKPAKEAKPAKTAKPVLLSGGNPQIAKGEGEAPVRAYIAAIPGWKRAVARDVDALITRTVPGVRKAVKWNSPIYGVVGQGFFLSFHCFTNYLKLAFFRGTSLNPMPPGTSKHPEMRYLDLRENEPMDEKQLARWIKQAAAIPGWNGGSPSNGGIAQ